MKPKRQTLPELWLAGWFSTAAATALLVARPSFDYARVLAGPERAHWLGFDAFGRDFLALILGASLKSAACAALTVIATMAIGLVLGSALALTRGGTRFLAGKALSGFLAFPSLLFALAWAAIRGPGWDTLAFSLLIGTAPAFTRYIQARADEILAEEFILASRSLGASELRIVTNHLIPSLLPYAALKIPNLFAQALLAEATLSFLGIGAPIGDDTWGSLLAQGREYLIEAPHIAFGAGVPLVLTVFALQLLSESRSQLQ